MEKSSLWKNVSVQEWYNSNWQLANAIRTYEDINKIFPHVHHKRRAITKKQNIHYNVFIVPFTAYQCIIYDKVREQYLPSKEETQNWNIGYIDSFKNYKKTTSLICRYPYQATLLLGKTCPVHCRYCSKKTMRVVSISGNVFSISPWSEIEYPI